MRVANGLAVAIVVVAIVVVVVVVVIVVVAIVEFDFNASASTVVSCAPLLRHLWRTMATCSTLSGPS